MIKIITNEGINLLKDEYDFIKIERNNIFLEIPTIDILKSDKLVFKYQNFTNNNFNDLKKEDINLMSFFLTNMIFEENLYSININHKKYSIYNKIFNIKSTKELNNKLFLYFTDSNNKNINTYLKDFKENKLIKKYFKNNLSNFKLLINYLLLKNSFYKNNQIEIKINKNYLNDIQEILLFFKIKSIIYNNKLIITNKHSLIRLLNEFNLNNNLKILKTIVKDIEIDYLFIGENQSFFLSNIKEIISL